MAVPYTFANATTSIPLSQLDSNFATGITIGNTAVYLGNTTTSFGNVTLTNATISSGNATFTKITVPTVDAGSGNALTLQSNGTTGLYIDTSQNVGIGTSSPNSYGAGYATLQVNGSTSGIIQATSGGTTYIAEMGIGSNLGYFGTRSNQGVYFKTNDTERMRIDSSGNVGIGTSTPSQKLSVAGNANAIATQVFNQSTTSGSSQAICQLAANNGANYVNLVSNYVTAGGSYFQLAQSGVPTAYYDIDTQIWRNGSGSERMRIDSSGNLLVGSSLSTTPRGALTGYANSSNVAFFGNSSATGVYLVSGNTSWTATSDERLKDIIEPITDATNKVSQIRAVIGKYKTDEQNTRRSFLIAQDVQKVLPEAISVSPDEEKTLGLQYSEVIPLLVAAIQELKAEIDTLKGTK